MEEEEEVVKGRAQLTATAPLRILFALSRRIIFFQRMSKLSIRFQSRWGFCQCASYQPGGSDCWGGGGGSQHDGKCGSDADCPPTDPTCSE